MYGKWGRDVTGLRLDKKSLMVNGRSNDSPNCAVHVAPIAVPEKAEKTEEQEVLVVKRANNDPEENIVKAGGPPVN
ncbi:hypothetical protein OROMI_034683 [Orobanche minor]